MQNAGTKRVRIEAHRETLQLTGDVRHSLRVLIDPFFRPLPRLPSERCIDLVNIAAGIYAIDRLIKRTTHRQSRSGSRAFALSIAVRDLDFWEQSAIKARLQDIVQFLSDESWELSFEAAPQRDGEHRHQHLLQLPLPYQPERVALYSGGLDSAAGLANQLITGVRRYFLVTVGHQASLRRKTRQQIQELETVLGIPRVLHSTVVTGLRGQHSIALDKQGRTQRTRSLLFTASAIAAAGAFGIQQIDLFENGLGSINFPLMAGALFDGLATRGSHPTFLRHMSALGSAVLEHPLVLSLPFGGVTKAQMLQSLRGEGLDQWAQTSRSCIHSSWRVPGKTHCGTCPACIERRQAFATAGIIENDYYSTDIFSISPKPGADADYLRLYLDEAHAWLNEDPRPRRRLYTHLRLTDIPIEDDEQISLLHTRHSREVTSVFRYQ